MPVTFKYVFSGDSLQVLEGNVVSARANLQATDSVSGEVAALVVKIEDMVVEPEDFVEYADLTRGRVEGWFISHLAQKEAPEGFPTYRKYLEDQLETQIAKYIADKAVVEPVAGGDLDWFAE